MIIDSKIDTNFSDPMRPTFKITVSLAHFAVSSGFRKHLLCETVNKQHYEIRKYERLATIILHIFFIS